MTHRKWQGRLLRWTQKAESSIDNWRNRVGKHKNPLMIQPYLGFGNAQRVFLRARVLEDKGEEDARADDSAWTNFRRTMQRFASSEVPHACISVELQGKSINLHADEEGYIEVWLELSHPLASGTTVKLAASLQKPASTPPVTAILPIYIPDARATFMIISDIDDTILQSKVTRAWQMMQHTFLKNAHSRLPFVGVAQLYRALTQSAEVTRPIFYVSSSPWNLYPMLTRFMELNAIPQGALNLRDWGISDEEFLPTAHKNYKLEALERIMDCYPKMPVLLLGDNGQQDPEIYQQLVQRYPDRVLGIYIREVSQKKDVEIIAQKVRSQGVAFTLVKDSLELAEHALGQGWLEQEWLEAIRNAIRENSES